MALAHKLFDHSDQRSDC